MTDSVELMIGRIEGRMDGIGREIGEMKKLLECKTEDCSTCRKELDSRDDEISQKLATIENVQSGEKSVQTWKDAIFSKSTAIVVLVIGGLDLAARYWPWGR
jgi:hypothetical protein